MDDQEHEYQTQLAEDIGSFAFDPYAHAMYAFPWGEKGTFLEYANGPRTWQKNIQSIIGEHLSNPETRFQPCRIAVASGHGIGKGHPVDMDYFGKPWGEIRLGDTVFGVNGDLLQVQNTNFYKRMHYLVSFDDGSSIEVSGDHLWKVKGRKERRYDKDFIIKDTKSLLKDYLRPNGVAMVKQYEIPIQQPVFGTKLDVKTDPYTYGVWLGDGNKSCGRITNIDQEVWDNIAYETKGSGLTRTAYGLKKDLVADKLFGCTTYTAMVSEKYKHSCHRLDVLQGLLDTDGWVEKCGSAAFASASRQLTKDVVDIARALGLKAREPKFKSNDHAGSWSTHITWNGEFDLFRIKRKQEKLIKAESRYQKRWISKIEETEIKDGMCIEVEGGLYLTPDYHVTHNSALIGMLIKWGMDTCVDTRITCTANTDTQMRTKTVPEVTKWVNGAINADWFTTTATAIYSTESKFENGKKISHDKSWRTDFVPWSKDNTEAFAGLHNERKRLIIIYDEASGIHDKVWEVTEGALTDKDTEIIWIAFGNPTQSTGEFRECFRKNSKLWHHINIDSRDVEGVNLIHLQELCDKWGEDSDRFKVRVRGVFPNLSIRQLFDSDKVREAYGRHLRKEQYDFAPKIIAVDPAWEGDDELVVGMRQGLKFDILFKLGKNTNDIEVANKIARIEDEEEADAVFVDGGFGTGIVSAGRTMGRNWQLVWFSGKSPREDCVNLRAAMYQNVSELLGQGLAIPKDQDLYDEMLACETEPTLDGKIKLPPKEDTKEILGHSPNCIDTLAISTAFPVVKKRRNKVESNNRKHNPMDRVERKPVRPTSHNNRRTPSDRLKR